MPTTMKDQNDMMQNKSAKRKLLPKIVEYRWVGRWIIGVAITHIAFTFILFPDQIKRIFQEGFYNTGLIDYEIGKTIWFFLFGIPLFLIGYMIDRDEKKETMPPFQEVLLYMLIFMTLLGIVLIPTSGFWLMLPAIFGFFCKNRIANIQWR